MAARGARRRGQRVPPRRRVVTVTFFVSCCLLSFGHHRLPLGDCMDSNGQAMSRWTTSFCLMAGAGQRDGGSARSLARRLHPGYMPATLGAQALRQVASVAVEFRILGPVEVHGESGAVALRAIKLRAVLAMLLLHPNESVHAERLALALWGEDAPAGFDQDGAGVCLGFAAAQGAW
jgi:hypothetical protein